MIEIVRCGNNLLLVSILSPRLTPDIHESESESRESINPKKSGDS